MKNKTFEEYMLFESGKILDEVKNGNERKRICEACYCHYDEEELKGKSDYEIFIMIAQDQGITKEMADGALDIIELIKGKYIFKNE